MYKVVVDLGCAYEGDPYYNAYKLWSCLDCDTSSDVI